MKNLNLPAACTTLTENEKMDAMGGSIAGTAVKAVVAVGVAAGLTGVAAVAAKGILSIFDPHSWNGLVEAGQNFLNKLMGIEQL